MVQKSQIFKLAFWAFAFTFLPLIYWWNAGFSGEVTIRLPSDRSISSVGKCIGNASKKIHPALTRYPGCTGRVATNGYCGKGDTFIAPNGDIRVTTKLVDGRSEILITHNGKVGAPTIDAVAQCQ